MLACLALAPSGVQPRDRLLAMLWPDVPPAQAGNSFRQALFALRRALEPVSPHVITASGGMVTLALDAVEVDVHAFERLAAEGGKEALAAAADLYGGDLLDGVEVDEPAFDDWCTPRRERLRRMAQDVLRRLMARRLELGEAEPALEAARRLLELEPLAEDVHARVMRLYVGPVGSRRRSASTTTCVASLRREVGARPGPELQRLYQQIRQRELPVARPAPRASPFVGRSAEVALLRRTLAHAWKGHGQVVAVVGEAGIGKSRLVEEIATEVRARYAHVATGRCHETQRILPFGPWLEALRHGGLVADDEVLAALGAPGAQSCRGCCQRWPGARLARSRSRIIHACSRPSPTCWTISPRDSRCC